MLACPAAAANALRVTVTVKCQWAWTVGTGVTGFGALNFNGLFTLILKSRAVGTEERAVRIVC